MDERLSSVLADRQRRGLLRTLTHSDGLVDFSSNDYLGLSRSSELAVKLESNWRNLLHQRVDNVSASALMNKSDIPPECPFSSLSLASLSEPIPSSPGLSSSFPALGSTGSRLLSGNSHLAEELESFLAKFHDAPAALLFNSGYDANLGFFSCVPQRGDHVFYDELIHASVHDGMRASRAERVAFRHNNIEHLTELLQKRKQSGTNGHAIIVVESVYSMDGDEAPLAILVELCRTMQAYLVVDEAHATGLVGPNGAGCVQALGLQAQVFARLHTFGKAVGCHGAAILGSTDLRLFLINYARPLIYSTSLPPHSLVSIKTAYQFMGTADDRRAHLNHLVKVFQSSLSRLPSGSLLPSKSAIQGVILAGNDQVVKLAVALRSAGFDVKPIRSPTVPAGTERVRICLHAHNTIEQVQRLCDVVLRYFQANIVQSARL